MTKKISGKVTFPLISPKYIRLFHIYYYIYTFLILLQSALLVISCTRASILRAGGIEVIRQGDAHLLCVLIHILIGLADGIVRGDLRPRCAENVIGIKRARQAPLPEGSLQSGIHCKIAASIHESPMVAAGIIDLQKRFGGWTDHKPAHHVETEFRLVQFLGRAVPFGIEHLLIVM